MLFDYDKWQEIVSALKKNKLRTFLTVFGVFWGIFMLIMMIGAGNGLKNAVYDGFQNFATNSAFMWPQRTTIPYKGYKRNRSWNFTTEDMVAIRRSIPEIKYLAPRLQGRALDGGGRVVYGIKTEIFDVSGNYPDMKNINPLRITHGRFLNEVDMVNRRKVAFIGNRVHELLFEDEDPIGKYIYIQGIYWQVAGVFEPENKKINIGGRTEESVYLPLTAMQQAYNLGNQIHYISLAANEDVDVEQVINKAKRIFAEQHTISPDDERAFGGFNLSKEFQKMNGLFTGISVLTWIVGIGTLLAGVISISNIMLIIVRERTKEIGIQRAIGAKPKVIIQQIILESVFLTTITGYFGLIAGVGLLALISSAMANAGGDNEFFKNPEVSFEVAIISLTILILSGVIAGFLPAKRAVSIKPIDALRAE